MKAKSFLSLVLLLIIVGALWFFLKKDDNRIDENSDIGTYLFSNLPVDLIASVFIEDGNSSVTLVKKDDSWIVSEKEYNADLDKMRSIVGELRGAKIWKVIKATDELKSRLHLIDPSEASNDKKAVRLVAAKENGEAVIDMLIGSFRVNPKGGQDGRYIIKKGRSEVINIDASLLFIDALPQNWLNTKLIDIKSNMIKKISAFSINGAEIFSFERSEETGGFGPFPKDKEPLTRLAESLENLTLIDVLSDSDISINFENYFNFELSDGAICKVYPAAVDDKKLIKIEFFPNEFQEEETSDRTINVDELQKRFARRIFIVSPWVHEAFIINTEDLFEEEEL